LIESVVAKVRKEIGPVAAFKSAVIVPRLPKTRSGKIPRATLKSMINNKTFKIPTTVDDRTVYDEIRKELLENGYPCGSATD
jgi:propionyl-CoA synthetase